MNHLNKNLRKILRILNKGNKNHLYLVNRLGNHQRQTVIFKDRLNTHLGTIETIFTGIFELG